MPKSEALWNQVAPKVTQDLNASDRATAEKLLRPLLADWVREAGDDATTDDTLVILKKDLFEKLEGRTGPKRLEVLLLESTDRRVRTIRRDSYALGAQVIDHAIADDQARAQGKQLMQRIDDVIAELSGMPASPTLDGFKRDLQEASLEALYAIERKAMSSRLNRYAADRGKQTGPKVH